MRQKKRDKENRIYLIIISLVIALFCSSGCSDQKNEALSKEKEQATTQTVAEVKKEPEKVVYKQEVYGDPEIFNKPRLQFAWQAPMEEDQTIWSTYLDGSDLRRVLSPELLFKEGGIIRHLPIRSPDNRYLAVSLSTSEVMGTVKALYDLKEKTVTELGQGAFVPHFQWTADSMNLYYYNEGGFWKYHVKTKKNRKMPTLYSIGFYILNDDRFVALHSDSYSVHAQDGKERFRKEITGGGISTYAQAVSHDGSMIFLHIDGNKKPFNIIFDLNNLDKVIFKSFEINIANPVFGPKNKKLYFSQGIVESLDLETKEIQRVFDLPERPISDLSILNGIKK